MNNKVKDKLDTDNNRDNRDKPKDSDNERINSDNDKPKNWMKSVEDVPKRKENTVKPRTSNFPIDKPEENKDNRDIPINKRNSNLNNGPDRASDKELKNRLEELDKQNDDLLEEQNKLRNNLDENRQNSKENDKQPSRRNRQKQDKPYQKPTKSKEKKGDDIPSYMRERSKSPNKNGRSNNDNDDQQQPSYKQNIKARK